MKALGAILTTFVLFALGFGAWRLVAGVEGWFARTPAAGNAILWTLVAALVLAVLAIPAAAWGLAARAWVIRLREGEHLESHAHALLEAQQRLHILEQQVRALPAPTSIERGNVHASDYQHPAGRERAIAPTYRRSDLEQAVELPEA